MPQSPDALIAEAEQLSRAYDFEAAMELAEAALALDPLHIEAHELLQQIHARLGNSFSLEPRYRALAEAYPDSAAAYYLLSTVASTGALRDSYLQYAMQLDPSFAPAMLALATRWSISDSAELLDASLQLARSAVAAMPGDYGAAGVYVSTLMQHNRGAEAAAFVRQMAAQYPHELRYWTLLWQTEQWRVEPGLREASLLQQINAQRHRFMDSLEHMEMLATVLGWAGEEGRREAMAVWRAIADRYPEHPRAEIGLLQAMQLAEDLDVKREILAELDARYPESPARYAGYQDVLTTLIEDERYDEAVAFAKMLLTLPDPGFVDSGVARDARVRSPAFGRSLACMAHAGWFTAAQTPFTDTLRQAASADARRGSREPRDALALLDAGIPIAGQAVAAARALSVSDCAEARVFLMVAGSVIHNGGLRSLGIALLERAIALYDDPARERPVADHVDHYRELLPYLYLREGRLGDAVLAVDGLLGPGAPGRRTPMFFRIAGEVYETAGRLEEARHAYLRALRGTPRDIDFSRRALDRISRALASAEIVVNDPARAPRLPLAGLRVRRVHLEINAPLHRFLGERATLVLLWSPSMDEGRVHAESLATLVAGAEIPGLQALSIAVDRKLDAPVNELLRNPIGEPAAQGVAMTLDTLARWSIDELPTTLLIDGEGRVLARQTSYGVPVGEWREGWNATLEAVLGRGDGLRRPQ